MYGNFSDIWLAECSFWLWLVYASRLLRGYVNVFSGTYKREGLSSRFLLFKTTAMAFSAYYDTNGYLSAHGRTASKTAAACNTVASSPRLPII